MVQTMLNHDQRKKPLQSQLSGLSDSSNDLWDSMSSFDMRASCADDDNTASTRSLSSFDIELLDESGCDHVDDSGSSLEDSTFSMSLLSVEEEQSATSFISKKVIERPKSILRTRRRGESRGGNCRRDASSSSNSVSFSRNKYEVGESALRRSLKRESNFYDEDFELGCNAFDFEEDERDVDFNEQIQQQFECFSINRFARRESRICGDSE